MAKKNFSGKATGSVYAMHETIAEATAPAEQPTENQEPVKEEATAPDHTRAAGEPTNKKKPTQGRKGQKLHRHNMAFYDNEYEYVEIMARACGVSMTEFVNAVIRDHMNRNAEDYAAAKRFQSKFI